MASLGTVTIKLHLTTEVGGPIELAVADINVPVSVTSDTQSVSLAVNTSVLRHEIANALIDAANKIDVPTYELIG